MNERLSNDLNEFIERGVDIQIIRVVKSETNETLIKEEALLLANYLRNETKTGVRRFTNKKGRLWLR